MAEKKKFLSVEDIQNEASGTKQSGLTVTATLVSGISLLASLITLLAALESPKLPTLVVGLISFLLFCLSIMSAALLGNNGRAPTFRDWMHNCLIVPALPFKWAWNILKNSGPFFKFVFWIGVVILGIMIVGNILGQIAALPVGALLTIIIVLLFLKR